MQVVSTTKLQMANRPRGPNSKLMKTSWFCVRGQKLEWSWHGGDLNISHPACHLVAARLIWPSTLFVGPGQEKAERPWRIVKHKALEWQVNMMNMWHIYKVGAFHTQQDHEDHHYQNKLSSTSSFIVHCWNWAAWTSRPNYFSSHKGWGGGGGYLRVTYLFLTIFSNQFALPSPPPHKIQIKTIFNVRSRCVLQYQAWWTLLRRLGVSHWSGCWS